MEPLERRNMAASRSRVVGANRKPVADTAVDLATEARQPHRRRLSPEDLTAPARGNSEEHDSGVVPEGARVVSAPHRRLLQHGIHAERGFADLLRGPW